MKLYTKKSEVMKRQQRKQDNHFESNKTARISGQSPECSDCSLIHIQKFLEKENIENV